MHAEVSENGATEMSTVSTSRAEPKIVGEVSRPEVSVVIPCLQEPDTLETCIQKAQRALQEHNITGEIIVADNGSTDGSQAIAVRMGARVVHVASRGYGSALMGGIAAAQGQFIIMGDADDSYNFLEIPKFVEKLQEGFDLVQGCRLPLGEHSVILTPSVAAVDDAQRISA
jgi:glycosyltransferase involved in cell wall biosynthesis